MRQMGNASDCAVMCLRRHLTHPAAQLDPKRTQPVMVLPARVFRRRYQTGGLMKQISARMGQPSSLRASHWMATDEACLCPGKNRLKFCNDAALHTTHVRDNQIVCQITSGHLAGNDLHVLNWHAEYCQRGTANDVFNAGTSDDRRKFVPHLLHRLFPPSPNTDFSTWHALQNGLHQRPTKQTWTENGDGTFRRHKSEGWMKNNAHTQTQLPEAT